MEDVIDVCRSCAHGRISPGWGDVMLAPPQHGAPLNDFLKPYGEREGVPLEGLVQVVSVLDA